MRHTCAFCWPNYISAKPKYIEITDQLSRKRLSKFKVSPQQQQQSTDHEVTPHTVSHGDRVEFVCLTKGSKPGANINWYRNDKLLLQNDLQAQSISESVSSTSQSTSSLLSFIIKPEDDQVRITCEAFNSKFSTTSTMSTDNQQTNPSRISTSIKLDVLCKRLFQLNFLA